MSDCKHDWQPISLMGLSGAKCAKCGISVTANAPTMCMMLTERDCLAARIAELEAALRAVAEADPVVEAGGVWAECGLCGGRDRDSGHVQHMFCPWLAARKLLGMEAE